MEHERKRPSQAEGATSSSTSSAPMAQQRVLDSSDLLDGHKEVLIVHHGEVYRLRETRNGKLLLGK